MLICVAFFALGSALAGAAQNMHMLIAARSKVKSTYFHAVLLTVIPDEQLYKELEEEES